MSVMMDSSAHFHQPAHLHRVHSAIPSHHSLHPINSRGGIQKRTALPRDRSVSTAQAERLHHLAADQAHQPSNRSVNSPALSAHWLTPQPSPQPHAYPAESSAEALPQWTVPTPPKSDPGVHQIMTIGSNDVQAPAGTFDHFDQSAAAAASAEMSSLGYLLPSQYGAPSVEGESNNYAIGPNYNHAVRVSQPAASTGAPAYTPTISSSPAIYPHKPATVPSTRDRRPSEASIATHTDSPHMQSYRRPSNAYEAIPTTEFPMGSGHTVPSMGGMNQNAMPSPSVRSHSAHNVMHQYHPNASRTPNAYENAIYAQSFATPPAAAGNIYAPSTHHPLSYPPPFVGSSVNEALSKPLGSDSSIRILNQRPKPQCWEHGCNGRQFSTFSNLLRHQREKSGTAAKSYCPKCGAEFTRTTARNGHLAHDKCTKQGRPSEEAN